MVIKQQQDQVRYLQFEHYKQFPELTHGVFMRHGGYSEPPFEGLNTSYGSGDNVEHVIRNRFLALQTLDIEEYPCATVWQVHGDQVSTLEPQSWEDWGHEWARFSYQMDGKRLIWTAKPRRKADAIITNQPDVTLAMSFADCVPVTFYDPVHHATGLAHAGWRGTARGIVIATVEAMQQQFGTRPQDLYAGIGPSIGLCCYEVSEQVQRLFMGTEEFEDRPTLAPRRNLVQASAVFVLQSKNDQQDSSLHLDLWETNRQQLLAAGLPPAQIEVAGICTRCNVQDFYSHRGENGKAGRFPVLLSRHS
ncbi:MAG TPA: peptidoglycan editing factor PgeF [Ktedonobacteraceae bacterium]|nr:peptidoglycan editing factor PgeF [Ktedonobacteraceae bacterium]